MLCCASFRSKGVFKKWKMSKKKYADFCSDFQTKRGQNSDAKIDWNNRLAAIAAPKGLGFCSFSFDLVGNFLSILDTLKTVFYRQTSIVS